MAKACDICGVGQGTGVLGWQVQVQVQVQVERSHLLGQDIDLIARQSTRPAVPALMLAMCGEAG